MNKEKLFNVKNILIALFGLFLFYLIQYGYQIIFYNILIKNNFLTNNILLLIMEIIMLITFVIMNYKKLKNDYQNFNNNYKSYLKISLKIWLIGLIIMYASNLLISIFITDGIPSNEQNDRLILQTYPIYAILAMTLLGPIIEELVFRGNFKEAFNNNLVFIIITSLIFALAHVLNNINSLTNIIYIIPYGSLSIAFGLIYTKTNNIYSSIIIHSIHNTLSVTLLVLLYTQGVL